MAYGYTGRVLRVDLTGGTLRVEEPPDIVYRRHPGGSSLALYYLLNEVPAGADPLGPDNRLVFATGVLTGCPVPGASRYTVAARSPLSGAYGESEAGGWWGPELKFAGFDAVVVEGISPRPVYLWIGDGEARLAVASDVWGRGTKDTQDFIREQLGDERVRVACIGPAGERLVRFACIVNNVKHVNGGTGMGAVMGSKKLKAIAVRGTDRSRFRVKDETVIRDIARSFNSRWRNHAGSLTRYDIGTARLVLALNAMGILPTRNFREGQFEGAEDLSGDRMRDSILVAREGCFGCPVRCKRVVRTEGRYEVDPGYGGPEYETLGALGTCCGVKSLPAVAKGNELCNRCGLDSISTGVAIAFAMECYEKGLLTKDDTGGLVLEFGNAGAMVEMVEAICERRGLGRVLGEGLPAAAKAIGRGAEDFAMQVKGQALGLHDPRGKWGVGLAYAVSPTGPDHMEIAHDPLFEQAGPALDKVKPLGILEPVPALDLSPRKVKLVAYLQMLHQLDNILGVCHFNNPAIGPLSASELVAMVSAATGWETSLWELMKVSERTLTMARLFNLRNGIARKDDTLPPRLFEPLPAGPAAGAGIDREQFEKAVTTYYAMMGWDPQTGTPGQAKLQELDLDGIERGGAR